MTTLDALLSVTGRATVRDADLPADAVLTIKLVTVPGEVLAATAGAEQDDAAETIPFELVVDAALAPDPGALRLWAMLRSESGVWGTPELVTLREELVLSRVDG